MHLHTVTLSSFVSNKQHVYMHHGRKQHGSASRRDANTLIDFVPASTHGHARSLI